jgi:hypothetical protein
LDCGFYDGRQRVLTRPPLTGVFGEPVAASVLHLLCGNKAEALEVLEAQNARNANLGD